MEIADGLGRSPREVLTSITLKEFMAYVLLANDRADEFEEAKEGDNVVDLDEPRSAEEIAAMFGARIA
jgi:hypothetical protein